MMRFMNVRLTAGEEKAQKVILKILKPFNTKMKLRINYLLNYILKTPHLVTFSVALPPNAALRPCPRILLVCAGGIIPSSQRRAEENTASLSRSIRAFSSGSTVLPTAAITELSCSDPITPIFAFGHIQRNLGE